VKLPTISNIVAAKAPSPEEMYVLDSEGKAFKSIDYGEEWFLDKTLNESNSNSEIINKNSKLNRKLHK
jgi:hypothetical protein